MDVDDVADRAAVGGCTDFGADHVVQGKEGAVLGGGRRDSERFLEPSALLRLRIGLTSRPWWVWRRCNGHRSVVEFDLESSSRRAPHRGALATTAWQRKSAAEPGTVGCLWPRCDVKS